jgi:hypothetical protein
MRVILAGVLGGILMFMAGAFEHMVLQWGGRAFKQLPDEQAFREFVASQKLEHGVYGFPGAGAHGTEEEWKRLNELYKQGPNGLLFIGRTNEESMSGRELGLEAGSNIVVALLAAFIVSRLRVDVGFCQRWLVVFLFGVGAWFSISASHAIWYRFHWEFARDELLCVSLEAALAGLLIAAIVKPIPETAPPPSG